MLGLDTYDGTEQTEQYAWVLLESTEKVEPMEVAAAPRRKRRSQWRRLRARWPQLSEGRREGGSGREGMGPV